MYIVWENVLISFFYTKLRSFPNATCYLLKTELYPSYILAFFVICVLCAFFSFTFISWRLITLQYCSGFCHTLTWISHEFIWMENTCYMFLYLISMTLKSVGKCIGYLIHRTRISFNAKGWQKFSVKISDSKYFRFCEPYHLSYNFLTETVEWVQTWIIHIQMRLAAS